MKLCLSPRILLLLCCWISCFVAGSPDQAQACGRVFKEDTGTFALDEIITSGCHPRFTLAATATPNILVSVNDIQCDGPMGIVAHGHELTEGEEYCMPTPVTMHLGAPSAADSVHFRGTLRYRPAPGACDPDQFNRPATAATAQLLPERLLALGKNFSLVGHLNGVDGGGSAQFMSAQMYKATSLHPPIVQSNGWNGGQGALIIRPCIRIRAGDGPLVVLPGTAPWGADRLRRERRRGEHTSGTFGQKFYYLSNGDLLIMYMDYKAMMGPRPLSAWCATAGPGAYWGQQLISRIGWNSVSEWPCITELPDGSYLIRSPKYYASASASLAGAVTWCAGGVGCRGVLNGDHPTSLVGSHANDKVGTFLRVLSDGTYVVSSPAWYSNRGFVAVGNSTHPVAGVVSAANSLLGAASGDKVGSLQESMMFRTNPNIHYMENGTFVVVSNVGAHVFFNPRAGIVPVGAVDETNALITGALGIFRYLPVSQTFVIVNTANNGYAHSYSGTTGAPR
ncbi:hypothetical protein PAPYR_7278 [Paratrimastix pyriformis]|uniref:Uncharacterized protein n=1 Tax=Paratrimastix pyriformis TaxID=342808 RepID=A0ABQ8UDC8_9EUKA|nr:hypothetical protein PAPYR_7278 [Paratrimastix pyriformis]